MHAAEQGLGQNHTACMLAMHVTPNPGGEELPGYQGAACTAVATGAQVECMLQACRCSLRHRVSGDHGCKPEGAFGPVQGRVGQGCARGGAASGGVPGLR